jgi:peptidoglycan hydrolase-like protein with peptidoglycan-binding domain
MRPRRPRRGALLPSAGLVAAAALLAACGVPAGHRPEAAASSPAQPAAASTTDGPLRVTAIRPDGSPAVSGATAVVVSFSAPLAPTSAMPALHPSVPGRWTHTSPTTVTFRPAGAFPPYATVRVTVPSTVRAGGGGRLRRPVTATFRVRGGTVARLQQLLAQLGYLPVQFRADRTIPATDAAAQDLAAFDPPAGYYQWRHSSWPSSLRRQWHPGVLSAMTRGAVMAFESRSGLTVDGVAGPRVWRALLSAVALRQTNPLPYDYAYVSKADPETLTIWRNGHRLFHSLANTGIPQSPTADGTFPVYARLRRQVMRGTFDGQQYADPVQFVAYFHGGDAVHYIARSSYGYPQSLGCVELPLGAAATAWPMLSYGTLVTVAG